MEKNFFKWIVKRLVPKLVICAGALLLAAASARAQSVISVQSAAFSQGGTIPNAYTCADADKSPPLKWAGVPERAKTLALICEDPDAPGGTFIHWVLYNLPGSVGELAENQPKTARLPQGGEQGVNDFGRIGYGGPCPPSGNPHHYHFRLIALDSALSLHAGASGAEVRSAARGHEVANGELVGTFARWRRSSLPGRCGFLC